MLVAGTITGFMFTGGTAKASTSDGTCTLGAAATSGTAVTSCTIGTETDQITVGEPLDIFVAAQASSPADGGDPVSLSGQFNCVDAQQQGPGFLADPTAIPTLTTANTAYDSADFAFEVQDPASCTVYVTATDPTVAAGDQITVSLEYDPNTGTTTTATASPTPTATTSTSAPVTVHEVHGFDGTCVDDFGNSSAERTKIGIWTCNSKDTAQSWTYSGDELHIHGMCINAKGNGKSGSKLILWKCNGAANEIFVHTSKQEYVEKTNGWKYCIDDPAFSTKNGTQLFVYACNNGPNQHWSLP
ncbi:MAG TPA: RICIN domain-containing protein [Streptosporangiaceae bacterium]|nr:RICIN domain-containing protein [Streptosporangiaceae bacterium]